MDTDDLFSWYEANLPSGERKRRGHFSTPALLVEQILDACGYLPDKDLSSLRILDPSCGSGNFLAGAARRLVAFARRQHLDRATLLATAQRNFWGFDPDPVACFLADMQVRTILAQADPLSQHARKAPSLLHIHQADGLALSWDQCENVDLFLANPPYLATKNSDLSGYRLALQRGQVDSYLLFISLALQVVRPGGWICLVLPDPVLARTNAAAERHHLLRATTVHQLWHFAAVFEAHVGAVVIIAQKTPPPRLHPISWQRRRWRQYQSPGHEQGTISQDLLQQQPGAELRYLLSEVQNPLIARLCEHTLYDKATNFMPLSHFVEIRRGEELGKYTDLLHQRSPADQVSWYPVLRGGIDVRPYNNPIGQCWIERGHIIKPLERYLAPKLLVVKSTGRLQAALDLNGHVVLQTLYLLRPRLLSSAADTINRSLQEKTVGMVDRFGRGEQPYQQAELHSIIEDLYYLLALLNSRLLQEYVWVLYTAYKWVQPQIEQHVLTQLPIPVIDTETKTQIARRAQELMEACRTVSSVVELELYEEQERAIQAIYSAALQKLIVQVP